MRILPALSIALLLLSMSSCAPNRSIALDNSDPNTATPTPADTPPAEAPKKITVAGLIDRVVNAPPDSFLFPCTLNAFSSGDREKLKTFSQRWQQKEKDARYHLSPSTECVCPGVCVLVVEDSQTAPPRNSDVVVIEGTPPETYSWLARDIDLTNARLAWTETTPRITFSGPDGKAVKTCNIQPDKIAKKYQISCSDPAGKKLASL